jgi:oligopeptide transport system ATP-binding protein
VALLEVENLHTSFRTRDGVVRAVDGISFEVGEGETLGLAGESGCGKSVTALSLMRLLATPPASIGPGGVRFGGVDLLGLREREMRDIRGNRMAMIFQDPMTSLNPVLPIGQQIAEPMEQHLGLSRSQARQRAIELLKLVGIPSAETRVGDYPHQFSGGMRQRVTIATALSCDPKLILADEITTALDVTIQAQILDVLRKVTSELGTALVLITHDLGVVAGMTQRVHIMYAGQIVEMADTPELFANPRMPYTWGLLRSIPRLDRERPERLAPIEGLPPDLIRPPSGCRFAPRCRYQREICRTRAPELRETPKAAGGHQARCWGTQDVPDGGWLIDEDWRRASPQAGADG